jgi:YHS domain-containing protein
MALISWIVRALVILFVIRIGLRFLGGVLTGYSAPGPSPKSNQPATREGGHLVRDPNCGTYVPMGRALREGSGNNAVYFCSETCRNAWAGRKSGVT